MSKLRYILFSLTLLAFSHHNLSAKKDHQKNDAYGQATTTQPVRALSQDINSHHLAFRTLRAADSFGYLPQVAEMRSTLYSAYPYLYAPSFGSEQEDVSYYAKSTGTILVGAFDDADNMIGFIIGLPLNDFTTSCDPNIAPVAASEKFAGVGVDLKTCFYVAELLVHDTYLNKGLESDLYNRLQKAVVATNAYKSISLLRVERGDNNPLKPADFVDAELAILKNNGFVNTEKTFFYQWNTIQADGSTKMQDNPMNFWTKQLNEEK